MIQGTDTDAAVSRLSAVELGYLDDPYAQYFVQNSGPGDRRLPIINRGEWGRDRRQFDQRAYTVFVGTYTRTAALNALIESFLAEKGSLSGTRQIVSLGAGTDTRPISLFRKRRQADLVYHEIDFPAACSRKMRATQGIPALRAVLPHVTEGEGGSWSAKSSCGGEYYCHGLDLRSLIKGGEEATLPGLRKDLPTLLISECCLCYLEPSESQSVLKYFTDKIPNTGVLIYEPVRPDDPFGKMMVSNLAARRIRMPTLDVYKEPADQVNRLQDAGFGQAKVLTVHGIFERWVAPEEKARLDRLEGLDEVEEWVLLANHYVVAWGWRGDGTVMCDETGPAPASAPDGGA